MSAGQAGGGPGRAALYLDAARHMRASQLAGRARRLVPPPLLAAGPAPPAHPEWSVLAAGLGVDPAPQSGPTPDPAETGAFAAVGRSRAFGSPVFWRDQHDGLLFLFHLHGFTPLAAYAAGPRSAAADGFWADVLASWLADEARPSLPAWHPYPTSHRIISWSAALGASERWPHGLSDRLAAEIWRQARYLRRAIEHDIGGNHVLKNATALVFAGIVVPASGTLEPGLRLLRRELDRQILPDGGHEERSTSYHRAVWHDLGELAELLTRARHPVPDWLTETIARMHAWQAALVGPDGRLPLLNDAWEGPPLAGRSTEPVTVLPDSGYVVLRHGDDQVVLDCGPICPPHLPPHAHADVLSFVLWADGKPVIVDSGTYTYSGPERDEFRGTAAHNTVEVDGEDQCVFWGDFRAGLHPRVSGPHVRRCGGAVVVEASHDGYRRLDDPVVHHRAWVWLADAGLVVVDRLACRRPHAVRSRLQLAPRLAAEGDRAGPFRVAPVGPSPHARDESASYAPSLGRQTTATAIVDRRMVTPAQVFGWSLLRSGASLRVDDDGVVEVATSRTAPAAQISLTRLA